MKSAGGARFPLEAAQRLGTDGLREAMRLLAQAELDLRGASGLDERTVIDVLVARLAALSRRHQPAAGSRPALSAVERLGARLSDVGAAHQARGAASGLVLVDDALGAGLAEPLLRDLHQLVGVVGAARRRRRGRP